jgi:hypothetical protein
VTRQSIVVVVIATVVALGAATEACRNGYTTDEEFTAFAVGGIDRHGLPLLPSGFLYDRGLAYSYAAWLTGLVVEPPLAAARVAALLAAIAALLALFDLIRRVSTAGAAMLATALVAVSLPYWAAATTARFYAPFLLFYLLALRAMPAFAHDPSSPGLRRASPAPLRLCALAFLARLTHEIAFTLAAVPLVALVVDRRPNGRRWAVATLAVTLGLVSAQALLVALHVAVEGTGANVSPDASTGAPASMIDRFFVWQVVNLVAWPLDPFEFLRHIAASMPLMTALAGLLLALRVLGAGRPWSGRERAVHAHWAGWVVFFGVIDSGITINYLLLPVVSMMAALAIDLAAVTPRRIVAPAGLVLVALVGLEQWGWTPRWERLEAVRPTIVAPAGTDLARLAAEAEHVACTDELACLLLAGRVDTWLALDPFLRERFIVSRNGRDAGVYAGSPVVSRLDDLFVPRNGAPVPRQVLVIDVFKDLPVGPSSAFLPRAVAASAVEAPTIAENPRMRVVALRPGARQALVETVNGRRGSP